MPATGNLLESHCRRIREVYPDLQLESGRLLPADEGQHNDLVVVNERLVFRFPRFVEGVARLSRLARILSLVRGHVTLSTPEPRYLALDPPEVGRAFLGYPLIPGQPLRTDTLESLVERGDASTLRHLATQLAGFLKQLHGISPSAVEDALPGETAQFRPLAEWEDLYARIARLLFPHMRADACATVAARFEQFLADAANRRVEPALVHGDFGTGNWLYDPDARHVTGVVDFDSCTLGDPAVDVAAGAQGPPVFVQQFVRTYGVTEAVEPRVRF